MEAGASGSAGATQPAQPAQPAPPNSVPRPNLTVPQLLAFGAFGLFALLALLASDSATVSSTELQEMSTLTMFLIGALLPSDALIRFGRALYYRAGSTPQPGIAQLKKV